MKRTDLILIGIILVLAAAGLFYINANKTNGDKVVIKVQGEVYKELPLNKDTTLEIQGLGGTNILVIKDGYADMTDADCPDKLCVQQSRISKDGESIICLPHQVVVEIESSETNDVDITAQ
jgi:hypothetical protein